MRIVLLALFIAGALSFSPYKAAATVGELGPGVRVGVRASGNEASAYTRVTLPAEVQAAAANSNMQVTYIGVPDDARAAIEYAVTIWEALVVSPVDITVEVTWQSLEPGLWGAAGFENTYRDFVGAPFPDTWYPIPIANALAGVDLLPGETDIAATFNSDTDWYLGTDGQAPPGTADLVTLALHELAHGLGFGSTFDTAGLLGKWRASDGFPFIYERFVENVVGQQLIDTDLFPNPSTTLGTAITSGAVYFDGPETVAANGGARPQLYAPTTWSTLSSLQHLDEDTFPTGAENSLMTPFFDFGEVIHAPGPVVLGILRDLGWQTAAPLTCVAFSAGSLGNGTATLVPPASLGCSLGTYAPGTEVTLVANAGEGWNHRSWTLDVGQVICAGCATTTAVMPNTAQTAVATFDDEDFAERLVLPETVRESDP